MQIEKAKAIVSGGASGLGFATAKRIVDAGGSVTLLDINEEQGEESAKALGECAHFLKADIASESSVQEAAAFAQERMGSITLAVNCAGILRPSRVLGRDGPVTGDDFELTLKVNVLGTFLLSKEAANLMKDNPENDDGERGVIINTASVAAFEGQIGQASYSASKGAVVSMTLPIAREFARFGIRVNSIAPGIFLTPMMARLPESVQKSLGEQCPFPPRLGRPDEYADLVVSIYGNAMINGETIRLDGAIRMQPK